MNFVSWRFRVAGSAILQSQQFCVILQNLLLVLLQASKKLLLRIWPEAQCSFV